MSKILKFINKNLKQLYLLMPLFVMKQDNIIVMAIMLLLFYLHSNLLKNITIKFNKSEKNNKNSDNNENDLLNELNSLKKSENVNNTKESENVNNTKENENVNNTKGNINVNNTKENININVNNNKETIFSNLKQNHKSLNTISENIIMNIDRVENKNNRSIKDTMEFTPYMNNRRGIKKNYSEKPEKYDFSVNVNSSICSTPIFNLRTYKEIDFYFNFVIHNYDTKKIHNLILCKDIHKWMNNSSLSDQDISSELLPIYFNLKKKDKVDVYEYLKVFIHNGEDGKIAFVQKGNDYLIIDKYINELIDKEIIYDLLDSKMYTSYNLYSNDGVNDFLNKFLSLVLISENSIGEEVQLDIENYYENKSSYEYFFNTINADSSLFNTTL